MSTPIEAPLAKNSTLERPTVSEAFAETVTAVPETMAPLVGAVMLTVGPTLSTVTVRPAETVVWSALSVAAAVS